jgi:flagellin
MISVASNIASLNARRNLSKTHTNLSQSIERLSSGLRINRAADDAAGLAVSESMRTQLRGLQQAERNSQDAISLIQTAEGGLQEVTNVLSRMRELAIQAANEGTMDTTQRGYLHQEFDLLESELNRIVNVTEYNGQALIDGTVSGGISFQIGMRNSDNDRISVALQSVTATSLGLNDEALSTASQAQAAISALDAALTTVNTQRGTLGATQNRLEMTISNLLNMEENLSAADSRIRDADIAEESAKLSRAQILEQAGTSVLAQANQLPQSVLSLIG